MITIIGKLIKNIGIPYSNHSENESPNIAAPIAFGGLAIIVTIPPIFAAYAIPSNKNLASEVDFLLSVIANIPSASGIIIAAVEVLLTQQAVKEVASISKIADL